MNKKIMQKQLNGTRKVGIGAVTSQLLGLVENDQDAALYANRCLAYLQIKQLTEALVDAEKCIHVDPHFPKGYVR